MKSVIYVISLMLFTHAVHAGERLNSDELQDFFSNKTLTNIHFKFGKVRAYYGPDGSITSKAENGVIREGKWWINDNAEKRCVKWDNKPRKRCHYMEKDEEGVYSLIHGKKGFTILKVLKREDGNTL